jgi:hypothetical protein
MDAITLAVPLLYILLVLGLCTYLLIRGVTHAFVGIFAAGALIELIPRLGFIALHQAPGGFGGNAKFIPILTAFGLLGTICFAAGFVSLTTFLLTNTKPQS